MPIYYQVICSISQEIGKNDHNLILCPVAIYYAPIIRHGGHLVEFKNKSDDNRLLIRSLIVVPFQFIGLYLVAKFKTTKTKSAYTEEPADTMKSKSCNQSSQVKFKITKTISKSMTNNAYQTPESYNCKRKICKYVNY